MRLPGPGDVIRLAGQTFEAVQTAVGLVPRIVLIVGEVETVIGRVQRIIGEVEAIQVRVTATLDRVGEIQAGVDDVRRNAAALVDRTGVVVDDAAALSARLEPIVLAYEPILHLLQPPLARLAATTSEQEVDAMVALIDMLPSIVGKLDRDILPVLDTLATVAPDLRDLLDVSKELNELIGSVPGLGRVKKRIEERQQDQDEYRADEEPRSAPDRVAIASSPDGSDDSDNSDGSGGPGADPAHAEAGPGSTNGVLTGAGDR